MGFWNKLGKIALQAAPYIAAPFTGGASLMATGVTQKLGQKWAEADAKKAIAKGLAPSKFDKYLGMASAGAGLASSFTGGFGGALSGGAKTVGSGVGAGAKLGSIASKAGTGASTATKLGGFSGQLANALNGKGVAGAALNASGYGGGSDWKSQLGNLMVSANQGGNQGTEYQPVAATQPTGIGPSTLPAVAAPRASSVRDRLNAGRAQAVQNQPFRAGYQTQTQGLEDGEVITRDIPPIYSDVPSNRPEIISPPISESTPIADAVRGTRRARRRNQPIQNAVQETQVEQ